MGFLHGRPHARLVRVAVGLLLVVALVSIASGCGRSSDAAATASAGNLVILTPTDGQTVGESPVTIGGTAPADADVVRDVRLARDEHVVADGNGAWSMDVDLDPGENDLTFRLGDDKSTAVTIHLTLAPTSADAPASAPADSPSVTPTPDATSAATPIAPTSTPAPTATPVVFTFSRRGSNTKAWTSKPVSLPAGTYEAAWTADATKMCGATMSLFRDPDDGFAKTITSVLVASPTGGVADLGQIPAGRYVVWSYTACPWTITLREATGTFVSGADLRAAWDAWDSALADATTGLFAQWADGVPTAGMTIRAASTSAVQWIDNHIATIRPEQQEATSLWRDAAVEINGLADQMIIASSDDELRAAVESVDTIRALRSDVADAFVAIR